MGLPGYAAIVLFFLVVMLPLHAAGRRAPYGVAKTFASITFVVAGAALLPLHQAHAVALLCGLALSLIGDVLLIPKGRRLVFLMGLASFLSAHAAYGVAFVLYGTSARWAGVGGLVLALIGAPIARWLLPRVKGSLRGPVIAYVVTITAMVTLSAGAVGTGAPATLLAGAALFYASDILVARERFVQPQPINGLIGLPLYYGAQLLLIAAFAV